MKEIRPLISTLLVAGALATTNAPVTPGQAAASAPRSAGGTGPTVPGPDPTVPQEIQPTDPGQLPPGGRRELQPVPGQPLPGQRGTIPEAFEPPERERIVVSAEDILKAQEALRARGHEPGHGGTLDAKTRQALREFQQSQNLTVTGALDQETAEKLGFKLQAKPVSPAPHR